MPLNTKIGVNILPNAVIVTANVACLVSHVGLQIQAIHAHFESNWNRQLVHIDDEVLVPAYSNNHWTNCFMKCAAMIFNSLGCSWKIFLPIQ